MLTKTDSVAEQIVERIQARTLAPGDRLPTSEMLAQEFGVSRGTARSVLERLFGRGLIYKRGNSWYVERRRSDR